ncbi:MAG: hypothetical protein M1822_008388 [Bathelium mastoideum]|nr:MAG: hypothetical protein M1822_008388 [Bathelium mastoideum]
MMALEPDINGNAQPESISLNQSAYQDNTLIGGSAPTMNGSSDADAPSDPNQIKASLATADTSAKPPSDISHAPTVSTSAEPSVFDGRADPVPSSLSTDAPVNTKASKPEAEADDLQPQATDAMDMDAVESRILQATEYSISSLPDSAPLKAEATPPRDTTSTVGTTTLPFHSEQSDVVMTDLPVHDQPSTTAQASTSTNTAADNMGQRASTTQSDTLGNDEIQGSLAAGQTKANEEPSTKLPMVASTTTNTESTDEAGSTSKIRPREDDGEGSSPASKRAKLDDHDETPPEFKVPDVPQHAPVVDENGAPSTDAAAQQSPSETTIPSALQYDTGPMTNLQTKALADFIKNVKKVKDAKPFLNPVDPVGMGIPTYPDIIKNPMDLNTMEKKLKASEYSSVADFVSDFDLMIQNCHTFNGPHHAVSVSGSNLQAYFRKALQKIPARDAPQPAPPEKKPKRPSVGARPTSDAPRRPSRVSGGAARSPTVEKSNDAFALGPDGTPIIRRDSTIGDRPKREIHRPARDLPYANAKPRRKKFQQELRFVDHVITEMNKPKYAEFSWAFSAPVDPVALNIPTYFSVIKKPMDFGTITQKQKTNQYENAKDFKSDVDLMFDNCYRFNPPTDSVHQFGKQYQDIFKKLWAEKDDWLAENAPVSGPQSPGTTPDSDDEDADDEEGEDFDVREAELRQIKQQIEALSQRATDLYGKVPNQKPAPKAPGRKNSSKAAAKPAVKPGRKSGSLGGPSAKAAAKLPKKPAKVKPLTQDEKTEIQEKVERLTEQYPEKAGDLVRIIKENDPKFANLAEDEIELELEELEVDVARMLLKYVRKFYPQVQAMAPLADDDDFEPERRAAKNAAATSSRKKNKPMTKTQQETDMSAIRNKLNQYGNPMTAGGGGEQSSDPQQQESSDDDDSGSESEEE